MYGRINNMRGYILRDRIMMQQKNTTSYCTYILSSNCCFFICEFFKVSHTKNILHYRKIEKDQTKKRQVVQHNTVVENDELRETLKKMNQVDLKICHNFQYTHCIIKKQVYYLLNINFAIMYLKLLKMQKINRYMTQTHI